MSSRHTIRERKELNVALSTRQPNASQSAWRVRKHQLFNIECAKRLRVHPSSSRTCVSRADGSTYSTRRTGSVHKLIPLSHAHPLALYSFQFNQTTRGRVSVTR